MTCLAYTDRKNNSICSEPGALLRKFGSGIRTPSWPGSRAHTLRHLSTYRFSETSMAPVTRQFLVSGTIGANFTVIPIVSPSVMIWGSENSHAI